MDRPFSTPGGGQVALLALSATLPRGTRLCFERRHSALLRRARRASEFYLLHRRGTRVFVFHCAHPRLPPAVAGPLPGRDDAPLVLFATLPRGTRLCFERRYSADLTVSKTRPLPGRDDAPQVIFATLPRCTQIGHCQRPSAIWLRALPADSPPHKQKRDRIDMRSLFGL